MNLNEELTQIINRAKEQGFDVTFTIEERKSVVPDSWEELEEIEGSCVENCSSISQGGLFPALVKNKNLWPTTELAKASLAMSQLAQLRNATWMNDENWEPDWDNVERHKWVIAPHGSHEFIVLELVHQCRFLAFRTEAIAKEFLEKHLTLMQIARPLL